jgi:RHS repeat-associated protein
VDCPIRFQGQWADEESGLCYNRFRYYEAQSGHYISLDSIGLVGGLNTYLYGANPINWLDPFGLCEEKASKKLKEIKPGTKEWNDAVKAMKSPGKTNYRVRDQKTAK